MELQEILTRIAGPYWEKQFQGARHAEHYMSIDRGITKMTLKHFAVGYNPYGNNLVAHIEALGYDASPLKNQNGYDLFGGYVIFPLFKGRTIVGATSRSVGKVQNKIPHMHLQTPIPLVYNWNASSSKVVYVTESPIDAMTLYQVGVSAVASMGAAAGPRRILNSLSPQHHIIIVPDNDKTKNGEIQMLKTGVTLWLSGYQNLKFVSPYAFGNSKDVNEYFLKHGSDKLLNTIRRHCYNAIRNSDFRFAVKDAQVQRRRPKRPYSCSSEDIVQLIGGHIPLKRVGKRYIGTCIFHADGKPSLVVYPETQSFYCFGCNRGGGSRQFLEYLNVGK